MRTYPVYIIESMYIFILFSAPKVISVGIIA